MKKIICLLLGAFVIIHLSAQNQYNLIPQPQKLTTKTGAFILKKGMSVSVANENFSPAAELLIRQANNVADLELKMTKTKNN